MSLSRLVDRQIRLFEFLRLLRADVQNLILTCRISCLVLSICDLDELQIDDFGLDSITIISPNHPENYPNNKDCSIAVKVGAGRKLLFEILALDVEYRDDCLWDFVQFHNGLPENAVMPEDSPKICGHIPSETLPRTELTFSSIGNSWFIRIFTDFLNSKSGFKFRFSSIRKNFFYYCALCKENTYFKS